MGDWWASDGRVMGERWASDGRVMSDWWLTGPCTLAVHISCDPIGDLVPVRP